VTIHRIREAGRLAVGTNQTTKAITQDVAVEVFLAEDADQRVVSCIVQLAKQHDVPIVWVKTMKQLGVACGIEVGAATAAIVEI
jgi:large subunit ribosomal protein L7A